MYVWGALVVEVDRYRLRDREAWQLQFSADQLHEPGIVALYACSHPQHTHTHLCVCVCVLAYVHGATFVRLCLLVRLP
jgi:hypothetical protein